MFPAYFQLIRTWDSVDVQYRGYFSVNFHSSLIALAWKPIMRMRTSSQRIKLTRNPPQRTNCWSCSFQQWLTCSKGCDCLAQLCPNRGPWAHVAQSRVLCCPV